jgi:hypothetical protein
VAAGAFRPAGAMVVGAARPAPSAGRREDLARTGPTLRSRSGATPTKRPRPPSSCGHLPHAREVVTVEVDDTTLRISNESGTILKTVPRLTNQEMTRHKAYGHRSVKQA